MVRHRYATVDALLGSGAVSSYNAQVRVLLGLDASALVTSDWTIARRRMLARTGTRLGSSVATGEAGVEAHGRRLVRAVVGPVTRVVCL